MEKLNLVSSIKHKEKLHVVNKNQTYFGCNQSWFHNETMIFGGCGPICAFNLFNYYDLEEQIVDKNYSIVSQLNQMYYLIKPTEIHKFVPNFFLNKKLLPPTLGVRSMNQFKLKLIQLVDEKFPKHDLSIDEFRFSRSKGNTIKASTNFIRLSLNANIPICFLNTFHQTKLYISNQLPSDKHVSINSVEELLSLKSQPFITHWVLVTGLYQGASSKEFYVECSTWGQVAYFKLDDFHLKQHIKTHLFQSGMLKIKI